MKQTMYLGPSVPGLIQEGVIYRGDLPERVQERAQKDKDFARLLVSMDRAMEALKEVKNKGTVLYVAYVNVWDGMRRAGEGSE